MFDLEKIEKMRLGNFAENTVFMHYFMAVKYFLDIYSVKDERNRITVKQKQQMKHC